MSELLDQHLSAYLDGALDSADTHAMEQRLATEPATAARFDGIKRANSLARDHFETVLNEPVPLSLARAIEGAGTDRARIPVIAPPFEKQVSPGRAWRPTLRILAASALLVAGGAAGGYMVATWPLESNADETDWLADIANYHRVYAAEKKHLVEVAASEKDHIETWLTKVVGVQVQVPDLQSLGLTFEGGRLLVVGSRPVAQLMYRHPDGSVVALCMIKSTGADSGGFTETTIAGSRLVSWSEQDSAYVVVGELGDSSLLLVAQAVAPLV